MLRDVRFWMVNGPTSSKFMFWTILAVRRFREDDEGAELSVMGLQAGLEHASSLLLTQAKRAYSGPNVQTT